MSDMQLLSETVAVRNKTRIWGQRKYIIVNNNVAFEMLVADVLNTTNL